MSEFKILCYTMRDRGTPPTWSWVDLALRMRCETNEIYPCWPCCSDFIIISNLHCHVKEYTTPAACGRGLSHISPFLILNCIRHWTRNTPATLTLVQRRRSSRCLILLIVCTCSVGIEAAGNTCFRGRTNQIWKTKGNAIKNELFIINGIRHVISDEMPSDNELIDKQNLFVWWNDWNSVPQISIRISRKQNEIQLLAQCYFKTSPQLDTETFKCRSVCCIECLIYCAGWEARSKNR